jgi:hypothetical protein
VFAIGRIERGPTGRVLTGGADLLLCGGKERDFLRSCRRRRRIAAALVVGGTAFAGLAAYMFRIIGG